MIFGRCTASYSLRLSHRSLVRAHGGRVRPTRNRLRQLDAASTQRSASKPVHKVPRLFLAILDTHALSRGVMRPLRLAHWRMPSVCKVVAGRKHRGIHAAFSMAIPPRARPVDANRGAAHQDSKQVQAGDHPAAHAKVEPKWVKVARRGDAMRRRDEGVDNDRGEHAARGDADGQKQGEGGKACARHEAEGEAGGGGRGQDEPADDATA
mmetsp:Transcript_36042/g.105513  ORF Transcript_36042/g.105513 Transcript_36042/m.105513 type:complete len:209 (-) Transcript_36042:18-644(-)